MSVELLGSDTLYQGRAFHVRRDRVRMPDGRETSFDVVQHVGAVTLIPVDAAGRIFFVTQYRSGPQAELLELPAGTLEPGEEQAACAAREVREEIGMAARHLDLLGEAWLAPGYSTEYMYFYLATELYPAPLEGDEDEFLEVRQIPIRQTMQMIYQGELQDGKSLAGLLLALPLLRQMFPGEFAK